MEWVETTGKTVEEAKDRALDQLGVDEQDAEFEVLEEPKLGLFGRLRSEARVRARVRPTTPRSKEDRRDKRRRAGGDKRGGAAKESGAKAGTPGGPGGQGGPGAGEPKGDAPKPSSNSKRRRGGGGRGGAGGGAGRERSRDREQEREREKGDDVTEDVSLAEQGEVAREFLDGLLAEFGASGTVTVNELDEETVEVAVQGDDLGLLIGPKGATLSALQEVTRTVVQRQTGGRNGRLLVDVASYRQKRKVALERFSTQIAEEVKSSGVRKVLEPMSAADRKVVHDTINGIDGVVTSSEGEDPRRRVVISPE